MSVLIKGIHLPTENLYPLHLTIYSDGSVFCGHGIGKRSYEAAEVPTPHGRLKDADELLKMIRCRPLDEHGEYLLWYVGGDDIKNAPTIIPAEEEEE